MAAGGTGCCGTGGSLGTTAGDTGYSGAGGSCGLMDCGRLGLLTQAFGLLLGVEDGLLALRARSLSLIYCLLSGHMSELVT